jgi:uncharacterized membrane protein
MIALKKRVEEIDVYRGMIMLLMALDHTRDFFGEMSIGATDLSQTYPALFFTRWITHLCAPSFVFLAGVSAYIFYQKIQDVRKASRFLFKRGLMLIIIEQSLLRCFGWYFNFDYHYMNANVLFGIGFSMILLSAVQYASHRVVLYMGLFIVLSHNLLDLFHVSDSVWWHWIFLVFFRSGDITFYNGYHFYISYPIIPWFGVMALGYGMGTVFINERVHKYRILLFTAAGIALLFFMLRLSNCYGDPTGWSVQNDKLFTLISFLNLEKYPPSLLFILMTISIALTLLSIIKFLPHKIRSFFRVFGRVPLFFYLIHIPVIHCSAMLYAYLRFGRAEWLYNGPGIFWNESLPGHPETYGLDLVYVYLIWIFLIFLLVFPCRWYARIKNDQKVAWLKYL